MKSQSRLLKEQILGLMLAWCMAALSAATEPTSSKAAPAADAKQQLMDLEKEWAAAEDKGDLAAIRRILDERFVATYGAKTYDREGFLQFFAGDVDPTASQTLTYDAVIIDGDTAVVVGTDTAHGTSEGAAYTVAYKYTATYTSPRAMATDSRAHRQGAASEVVTGGCLIATSALGL